MTDTDTDISDRMRPLIPESVESDDGPPEDTEPSRKRGRKRPSRDDTPKTTPPYRAGVIQKGMTEFYGTVGMVVMPFRPATGQALVTQAEACAEAWEQWAKENAQVRRVLMSILETTTVGKLVAAHFPIILTLSPGMQERAQFGTIVGNYHAGTPEHPEQPKGSE